MRNLHLLFASESCPFQQLQKDVLHIGGNLNNFCLKNTGQEKSVFFVTRENVLYSFTPTLDQASKLMDLKQVMSEDDSEKKGEPIGIEYIGEDESVCVCETSGEIIIYEEKREDG